VNAKGDSGWIMNKGFDWHKRREVYPKYAVRGDNHYGNKIRAYVVSMLNVWIFNTVNQAKEMIRWQRRREWSDTGIKSYNCVVVSWHEFDWPELTWWLWKHARSWRLDTRRLECMADSSCKRLGLAWLYGRRDSENSF